MKDSTIQKLIKKLQNIKESKLDTLTEKFSECDLMKMDGFDDCVEGVVVRFGQEPILCYNQNKVIEKLMSMGMDRQGAEEYFDFNQLGAWVGEKTPCFIFK